MRMTFHVLVALTVAAIAFVIGLCLPLASFWLFEGAPVGPGGGVLVIFALPLGFAGALTAGLFSFFKLRRKSIQTAHHRALSERGT